MGNGDVYKWSTIDRLATAIINFGGNVILARMLTTADFGLLAMVAIFIAIASDLSSCGLADGLIHKLKPTETDYGTVFIFNISMGVFFGSAFFFGAPYIAEFFHQEALTTIMRVYAVCFFLQTMTFTQETRLRKLLEMKKVCLVKIAASVSALILGIILAALGKGYWALVSTQIFLLAFIFVYYLIASRWFPKIRFSRTAFKEFFSYGVHLMLAYLGTIVGKNINTFVLGKFYNSSASGVYYQGAKLSVVPFGVSEAALNAPFFVVVSNESDTSRQRTMMIDMMSNIVGLNSIIMFLLILVAAPAILLLYGAEWAGAIPILQILAVAECLGCIKLYNQTVCKVCGKTPFVRNITVVEILMQLTLLAIFLRDGIIWIAWTQAGGVLLTTIIYSWNFCKLLSVRPMAFISLVLKALAAPALALAGGLLVDYLIGMVGITNVFVCCLILTGVYVLILIAIYNHTRPNLYLKLRAKALSAFHRK